MKYVLFCVYDTLFQYAQTINGQLALVDKIDLCFTCSKSTPENPVVFTVGFRLRYILADHLAMCILVGSSGGSSPFRNPFSKVDMRQVHLSMAFESEFAVLSATLKWLVVQSQLEKLYQCFEEIRKQYSSKGRILTIDAIKRYHRNIASVNGMVFMIFILFGYQI